MNKKVKCFNHKSCKFISQYYKIILAGLLVFFFPFVLMLAFYYEIGANEWLTWLLILVTGGMIWWQGQQIKYQLELQSLTESFKEWNSKDNLKKRFELWSAPINLEDPNYLDKVESVLEILEKTASYYVNRFLSRELIWDTIGWSVLRYYFYHLDALEKIRVRWGNDETLYCDMKKLYFDLVWEEICNRVDINNQDEFENKLLKEKDDFIKSELNTVKE